MKHPVIIRRLLPNQPQLLETLLYQAIYQPPGSPKISFDTIFQPGIYQYIQDFGSQPDDHLFVADSAGELVGGVWVRLLSGDPKGYGYVDDTTPELAISLLPGFRGKGIGTQLMKAMTRHLRKQGYSQLSLSVDHANPAIRFYTRLGFQTLREQQQDCVMVLNLGQ